MKSQKHDKALELAKQALLLVQDDYLFYYLAGTALLATKDFKNSIPFLEKASELNPKHSQICNNLGTAYLTTGDYAKSYEYYVKASELNPKNSLTFYNIASILQIQNKHEEACAYFKKAYDIGHDEHYLVSLALSEFKSKQYAAAIKHYKMLVSQHPEKHNFQYNLACCYEMTEEYVYAIGILSQLVLLNPKSKTMLQKLADLYLRIDQPEKAKEIYGKIIN
jgi:tetratricopeptide (TPR) repeat protein